MWLNGKISKIFRGIINGVFLIAELTAVVKFSLVKITPLGVATAQTNNVTSRTSTVTNNQTSVIEKFKNIVLQIGDKEISTVVNEQDNLEDSRFD